MFKQIICYLVISNHAPTIEERERLRGEGNKVRNFAFDWMEYKLWESGKEGTKFRRL